MAEDKKSFVVYSDWYGVFKEIPDDLAGKLIKHIFSYVNDENPQSDDFMINALFSQIKNTLKRDLEKWESQKKQRSEAGKRSAEKRNATKTNDRSISFNEPERKSTVKCNMLDVNVNVNDFLLEKETKENLGNSILNETVKTPDPEKEKSCAKKEKQKPPNLDEFLDYAKETYQNELKRDFSPFTFAVRSKYESWINADWKDGNGKEIKNWKSKLKNTIPHLKPIYNGTNNYTAGAVNGNQKTAGKVSARTLLAQRLNAANAANSESGNNTIDIEAL